MSTSQNIFGIRLSALIEMIGGLLILVLADMLFGQGTAFRDLEPHPFWLVVLLIAAQYGVNEALVAALFSSLLYMLIGDWPPLADGQDIFNYYFLLLLNPVLWFIVGLTVGALAERHLRKIVRMDKELDDSHQREETITESYAFVKDRKEDLETQLAGRLTSAVQAYKAAKAVETLNPKDVLRGVEDLVVAILNPSKFSVYTLQDNRLSANVLHGWSQEDAYKQDFSAKDELYRSVIAQQQLVCIANSDHEVILNGEGVLAGPIRDPEGGRVIGMLKIESMNFTQLGLQTIESFKALCDWIGSSLINAEYYQLAKDESVINPEHNLMTLNYFKRQSDYLTSLAKRVGFDLTLIVVRMSESEKLDDDAQIIIARSLSEAVKKVLRSIDLAFEYQSTGDEYSILLPATPVAGANIVREKLVKELEPAVAKLGHGFSYHIKALHEA